MFGFFQRNDMMRQVKIGNLQLQRHPRQTRIKIDATRLKSL